MEKHESVNEDCKEEIAKEDSEDEVIGEVTGEDEDDIPEVEEYQQIYDEIKQLHNKRKEINNFQIFFALYFYRLI